MAIWVDADAFSKVIKEIFFRAAERTTVSATLVENPRMRDFLETLRAGGAETGGPSAMTQRARRLFARPLDQHLTIPLSRQDDTE